MKSRREKKIQSEDRVCFLLQQASLLVVTLENCSLIILLRDYSNFLLL